MFKVGVELSRIAAISFCLLWAHAVSGQDIITLMNGEEIEVLVEEVRGNEVLYKRYDDPEGSNYLMRKSNISEIRYESGRIYSFNALPPVPKGEYKSQASVYELTYNKGVWQDGTKLWPRQVRHVMSDNSEALQKYRTGRVGFLVGKVIMHPGAFAFGWDIGTRLTGAKGNNVLFTVGAVGMIGGWLISNSGENQIKSAVDLYNAQLENELSYQISFGLTQSGVGLGIHF